jgi:hypothetical protein
MLIFYPTKIDIPHKIRNFEGKDFSIRFPEYFLHIDELNYKLNSFMIPNCILK